MICCYFLSVFYSADYYLDDCMYIVSLQYFYKVSIWAEYLIFLSSLSNAASPLLLIIRQYGAPLYEKACEIYLYLALSES